VSLDLSYPDDLLFEGRLDYETDSGYRLAAKRAAGSMEVWLLGSPSGKSTENRNFKIHYFGCSAWSCRHS
jgi:hypothetical protein